jgi:hypothetical protein
MTANDDTELLYVCGVNVVEVLDPICAVDDIFCFPSKTGMTGNMLELLKPLLENSKCCHTLNISERSMAQFEVPT